MEDELGRGGFGVVRRAQLGGQTVAAKILRSDESKDMAVAKRLVREMKIWSGLRHSNILPLIGFYLSQTLDRAIIVCPLVLHGSLQDYVRRETPDDASRLRLARDALSGLIYLHGFVPPVVHGDIKAANALVYQDCRVVLADFGLATAASEAPSGLTTSRGLKGSIRWWSPELFGDGLRSTASDIWAWACLLLEVMKGRIPYSWILRDILIIRAGMDGILPEPKERLYGPLDIWSVIGMCWEVGPETRAAGNTVLEELDTLIRAVECINKSEEIASPSGLSLVALPGSAQQHVQEGSRPRAPQPWINLITIASERYVRYTQHRDRADLDAAIARSEEAIQLRPPGQRGRSTALHNMALYLSKRYTEDRNRADLDTAITYQQEVLQLRPPGHRERSVTLHNLAHYFTERYKEDRNRADLDASSAYQQEALQLQYPGTPSPQVSPNPPGYPIRLR
ncbi:hypothetical protein FRB95_011566 [Tulasnella sp. JGI-2019a]|nr:hypothetical protein FRB95_011566 [Tulasnella sp. JGI-2019a]